MYVPHFNAFLSNIGMTADDFNNSEKVEVPTALLKFMMQILLSQSDFDEQQYMQGNPDVAQSVKRGDNPSARLHYIGFGFFEGRHGGTPKVDERWYRLTYPDVDDAIKSGSISSASQHYNMTGAAEGRSPNARFVSDAAQWKLAFGRT